MSPDRGEVSSPLVTVVVPAYNVRAHIERTISSLRRQSLRNIEVLVVDDCSTDDTRAVVTQAAGGDPRIRILSTGTNSGGVGEPRNVGLREARGSYVMFVDGDDELDRHALRRMAAEATAHDADLVCARMVRRDVETGQRSPWYTRHYSELRVLDSIAEFPELIDDTVATNKMYRVQWLRDEGFTFRPGVLYEDLDFTAKAYVEARRIVVLPDLVYFWNVYPEEVRKTITNQRDSMRNFDERVAALERAESYFRASGIPSLLDRFHLKVLRHHLRLYINDLLVRDEEFGRVIMSRIAEQVRRVPEPVFERLGAVERALFGYVLLGNLAGTKQALRHELHPWPQTGLLRRVAGREVWAPAGSPLDEETLAGDPLVARLVTVSPEDVVGPHHLELYSHRVVRVRVARRRAIVSGVTVDTLGDFASTSPALVLEQVRSTVRWRFPLEIVSETRGVVRWRVPVSPQTALPWDLSGRWRARIEYVRDGATNLSPLKIARSQVNSTLATRGNLVERTVRGGIRLARDKNGHLVVRQAATRPASLAPVRALRSLAVRIRDASRKLDVASSWLGRLVYWVARHLPIRENLLLAEHNMGSVPADSVLAVVRKVHERRPEVHVVWSVKSSAVSVPDFGRPVVRGSLSYLWYQGRAGMLVDNQSLPRYLRVRKSQRYLQTWHGIPLKVMGKHEKRFAGDDQRLAEIQSQTNRWTALVSPCRYFEDTFVEAFNYRGPLIRAGAPRNDVLFSEEAAQIRARVRRALGLPDDKVVVLYAPTFREELRSKRRPAHLYVDPKAFAAAFGDEAYLLVRSHYLNKFHISRRLSRFTQDVSSYPETSELILAADVLVTDYSSVMFDFALTRKPIVLFCPDYDDYVKARGGLYFSLRDSNPGVFTETLDELLPALRSVMADLESPGRSPAYGEFVSRYCGIDTGAAASAAVDYLLGEEA